jgi:hypothetical protein
MLRQRHVSELPRAQWQCGVRLQSAFCLEQTPLGIRMRGANLHPTPRINASTVGLASTPIPALAWIVYLWTRTPPHRILDVVLQIAAPCVLILGAGYCLVAAMIEAFFVG